MRVSSGVLVVALLAAASAPAVGLPKGEVPPGRTFLLIQPHHDDHSWEYGHGGLVAKLVDAMKERDRARSEVHQAVREASQAEARLELLEKRLRALSAEHDRLKKALGAGAAPTTQPVTRSLVLDMMIAQFRAEVERFRQALRERDIPPDPPPDQRQTQ